MNFQQPADSEPTNQQPAALTPEQAFEQFAARLNAVGRSIDSVEAWAFRKQIVEAKIAELEHPIRPNGWEDDCA